MNSLYVTASATVTPDNDAYTANDCVGGLVTFTPAGVTTAGAILNKLRIVDDDNEGAALYLWFFNSTPSTIADDAALALTAADLLKCVKFISVGTGDYNTTQSSLKYAEIADLNDIVTFDGAGNLYMYVQAVGAPTYAATKTLTFFLDFLTEGI